VGEGVGKAGRGNCGKDRNVVGGGWRRRIPNERETWMMLQYVKMD
jgi:hypothetical protein